MAAVKITVRKNGRTAWKLRGFNRIGLWPMARSTTSRANRHSLCCRVVDQ